MTTAIDFTVLTIVTLGPVLTVLVVWRAAAWVIARRQS